MKTTMTIGAALRKIKDLSENIKTVVDERNQNAWGFEEDQEEVFGSLTTQIEKENKNLIVLKIAIMKANLENTVIGLNLNEANLKIVFLRKEINNLKSVLKDPNKDSFKGLRFGMHGARKKEDIMLIRKYDREKLKKNIEKYQEELANLDISRTEMNFQVKISVDLE